ncbi:M23 family metallopeptidase [Pseudoduganella sp. OTU4001]|uniref:M23 family metallopeptidase n=1 Tax=Pseudoduganella sp. OTU4001 TaxID=3043854 RepID=UPI00313C8182
MPKITNILLLALLAAVNVVQPAAAMPEPLDVLPKEQAKDQQWRLPLDAGRVSSFFGAARGRRAHGGIDFSVPHNTPVMATNDGTVVASSMGYKGDRKYGNVVVIEHEGGLRSLYAHLNKRHVNVGDSVSAGELIGLSGATGKSTGPHLHLEAYQDGTRIDPNRFLLANLEDDALPSAMRAKRTGVEEVPPTARTKEKAGKKSKGKAARLASSAKPSKKKTQVAQKSSKSRKRA